MAEPASTSSTSLAAALVVVLGPVAGEYAAVVFAALAGALWPLSAKSGITRLDGAWLLLRLVLTAIVLTGAVVWLIYRQTGVPLTVSAAPVAFVIAAIGDRWRGLFAAVADRAKRALGGQP